jgi:hypothetical protein
MSNQNDDLVRVGVTGDVFMGPVGTTLPTDVTTALNAALKPVGHINPDAVTEALSVSSEKVRSWQKKAGIRTIVTEFDWTFQFTVLETSPLVWELYYGQDNSTAVGGLTTVTIENEIGVVQKACVIEITDGDVITRYAFPVVEVSDRGDVKHTGSEGTGYDLTISAVGDAANLAKIYTNDPAFAALAS